MISKHIKFLRDSAKIATLLVNNSSTNINEHGSKTKTDQIEDYLNYKKIYKKNKIQRR